MRRCVCCGSDRRRFTGTGICHECARRVVIRVVDVPVREERVLRLTLYTNGSGRRVLMALVDPAENMAGIVAGLPLETVPDVRRALERLEVL